MTRISRRGRFVAVIAAVVLCPCRVAAEPAVHQSAALELEARHSLERFLSDVIVPSESAYFVPGAGVDGATGVPYDHVRIRLKYQKPAEIGLYTAGSKLSLHIAVLLKIALGSEELKQAALTPAQARAELEKILIALERFSEQFPEYKGFFPWMEIRSVNELVPSSNQVPSLDNGQLTWTLAGIIGALEHSKIEADRRLVAAARRLLQRQDYGRFYDKSEKRMKGLAEVQAGSGRWVHDPVYFLADMNEGTMAVLWAVLHGQVPRAAWDNVAARGVDYSAASGEKVTTLQGYRGSFHEQWALLFLPFMDTVMRPLYRNYLYVHADYARRKQLPGFLSTANDSRGAYRQMGVPLIAESPGDRDDVAVFYATAMALAIDREAGMRWLSHFFKMPGLLSTLGALESAGTDGFADVVTADGKGLTLLAIAGGFNDYIVRYMQATRRPRSDQSLYDYFQELCLSKFEQVKQSKPDARIHSPRSAIPSPGRYYPKADSAPLSVPGEKYEVIDHLDSGHVHGKNVNSVGKKTLQDDVRPGEPIAFQFEIPRSLPAADQWAYRGTYLTNEVSLHEMRYVTAVFPASIKPHNIDIEFKRDNVRLAAAWFDTAAAGQVTQDGRWKRITLPIYPIPESEQLPLNYLALVIHDPTHSRGAHAKHSREGNIIISELTLSREPPFGEASRATRQAPPPGSDEILKYWVPSHGNLPVDFDRMRGVIGFSQGPGWRGGLIPYSDLMRYTHCHIIVKNLSGKENAFFIEFKRDSQSLFGGRFRVPLKADSRQRMLTIKLPQAPEVLYNYLILSDPDGSMEIASISFSDKSDGADE